MVQVTVMEPGSPGQKGIERGWAVKPGQGRVMCRESEGNDEQLLETP